MNIITGGGRTAFFVAQYAARYIDPKPTGLRTVRTPPGRPWGSQAMGPQPSKPGIATVDAARGALAQLSFGKYFSIKSFLESAVKVSGCISLFIETCYFYCMFSLLQIPGYCVRCFLTTALFIDIVFVTFSSSFLLNLIELLTFKCDIIITNGSLLESLTVKPL